MHQPRQPYKQASASSTHLHHSPKIYYHEFKMSPMTTTEQWIVSRNDMGFDGLEAREVKLPQVGETEVLVKLNAAALNYRDQVIAKAI